MMINEKNLNIFKDMSILIVDDDKNVLHLFEVLLTDIFKHIILVKDGLEGLEYFQKQTFDLIITDYNMPNLDGLRLIQTLRKSNKTIPIIFMTSSQEYEVYQKAINLNVTHSLTKPINQETIETALNEISEPMFFYQASQKTKKDELSDLQNQKIYNKQQQKQAFLKEHQAIRNDFYYSYYQCDDKDSLWYLDGSYRPHDILSGDTYSIRRLDDNRAFFFIIDAMGKGVSASVTSIVASSYINHMIDTYDRKLDFEKFLLNFNKFITKNLLDEEVLAVIFAELDFTKQTLCVSSYGMPPILLSDEENKIIKIKTNNLPISKHNKTFNIDCHQINSIQKMLFCSDGLVESTLDNGELYFTHLKNDFINSKTRSSFIKKLYSKVPHPDDDITLLFFQKRQSTSDGMISVECPSTLTQVERIIMDFHTYLEEHAIASIHTAKLGMIFTEMIMNAYEHGNLEISNQQKKELILNGIFEDEIKSRESKFSTRLIKINYLVHAQDEGHCLKFDIQDEGEGFDTKIFKKLIFDNTSVNGRGFKIAKKMVDAIYYSQKGNHVILHKYIPKEL